MKVTLVQYTDDSVCARAAATCTKNRDAWSSLKKSVAAGHESVLEHWSATFAVSGISRVCLAQLTRHRLASYSVESQRYCKVSGGTVCPESIRNSECYEEFSDILERSAELYEKMIACGIPREDARYILPEGTSTRCYVTMNGRELRHFFSLRCCNRAQWEIRALADEMLRLCKEASPVLFEDAGPECFRSGCKEVHSCGNPRGRG